ncbi:MAG: phage holin family protein [Bacteroidota bacterium]
MTDKKSILSFLKLDSIVDRLLKLVESKIEIAKIEIKKDLSHFLAKALVMAILIALGLIFFLFLNLALGFLISAWIGDTYSGFLIISAVYFLLFILFLVAKNYMNIEARIEKKLGEAFKEKVNDGSGS